MHLTSSVHLSLTDTLQKYHAVSVILVGHFFSEEIPGSHMR